MAKHKENKSKDCISLDLFVGDEDDNINETTQNVSETLCLKIFTKNNVKFRFGGLQIHIRSPTFKVGKSFHVNLDEKNRINSIESFREPEENFNLEKRRISLINSLIPNLAKITITPKIIDSNDEIGRKKSLEKSIDFKKKIENETPILTADILVEEIEKNN